MAPCTLVQSCGDCGDNTFYHPRGEVAGVFTTLTTFRQDPVAEEGDAGVHSRPVLHPTHLPTKGGDPCYLPATCPPVLTQ